MLHILNIPPAKTRLMEVALKAIAPGDALVFMAQTLGLLREEPQVMAALSSLAGEGNCELYALTSDCQTLGAAELEIKEIDYRELVALATKHPSSQTWF